MELAITMDGITELISVYGYIVLFLGVVAEGEIFPLAAGWLTIDGTINIYWSILISFVGVVIGDILWFKMGQKWGRPLVDRFGKYIWLKQSKIEALQKHFSENGKKTLFITKFIYSFGHSSILVAGMANMNFREFIKVDIAAGFLWSVLFISLGRLLGESFTLISDWLKNITLAVIAVVVILLIAQTLLRKKLGRVVK